MGTLLLIGVLGAVSYIDFVAASLGAQRAGASRRAMIGAALGTLLGLPLGLPGVIFGPLVGAVIGEFSVPRHVAGRPRGDGRVDRVRGGGRREDCLAFAMIAVFVVAFFLF